MMATCPGPAVCPDTYSGARPAADREAGYVIPFVLVVVLILSLSVASLAETLSVARERAQLRGQETRARLNTYSIEQEIAYRALLEYYGKLPVDQFGSGATRYRAREPENTWTTDSTVYKWSGVYRRSASLPSPLDERRVSIQSTNGLPDLAARDPDILRLYAERLGLNGLKSRRAVSILLQYQEKQREKLIGSLGEENQQDPFYRDAAGKPLFLPQEVCSLEVWSEIAVCDRPDKVAFSLSVGAGMQPNLDDAPSHMIATLLGQTGPGDKVEVDRAWSSMLREAGVEPSLGRLFALGSQLVVAIETSDPGKQIRIRLEVTGSDGERPYAVLERVIEPPSGW